MAKATIAQKILARLQRMNVDDACIPKDFLDLGSRAAVDQTLSRLVKRGVIRRVARGIYDSPRRTPDPRFGIGRPPDGAVARAMARKTGSVIQMSGDATANGLGWSTQVPAKPVYLTDGP